MSESHRVIVGVDGAIRFIYSDNLRVVMALAAAGAVEVKRASHVEPEGIGWIADMRPSGGPVLYANGSGWPGGVFFGEGDKKPFETRQAALDAEVQWLREFGGM